MKPSWSEQPLPAASAEPVPAFPAPPGGDGPPVPARLDRRLTGSALGHGWAHPQIEQQIARARASAAEAARSEGYAAGWAQGRRAAAEAAAEQARRTQEEAARQARADAVRVGALLEALTDALHRADVAAVPAWEETGDALVDCAVGIARAVLGRELGSLDGATLAALRTAVRCLGEPDDVTVRVNPADVALLDQVAPGDRPARLRVVPDPDVAAGTVTASTVTQRVTVDVPAALAAAEEVLRG